MDVKLQGSVASIDAARGAFAAGDLAGTERMCAQILGQNSNEWRAWALLTETALLRGRQDAASVSADRAVALAPTNPIALVLRAKCLFVAGETRQACAATEVAAEHLGKEPDALDAVGAMFGLLGLQQRARELFRRAVAARPDVPQYLFNLAAAERMIGALGDAEAHCDAAIAHDRNYGLAHYLRSDLRTQSPDRNHIDEMETLLREGRLSQPSEIMLRFALGKECEDLDRWDRAFDHIEAGCDLQHRSLPRDPADEIREIDAIIRAHTRSWIEAAPRSFAAAAPVFVTGLPRTGTTLVERIIASHSAMHSVGETSAFAAEMRRVMAERPGGRDLESIGRRYLDQATALRVPDNVRFIDKTLENYLYCGLIHVALPLAKIILVQRHPMDSCWAIYKAHFRGKFSFAYHQIELADYYLAYRRLSRHWRAVLPPDALMEINYEDIVRDQAAASRNIIRFLGLPWEDGVMRFHESPAPSSTASAVQVRRPIYPSSVGKWRHHAERLKPLRERLAREIPEAELA
ncbi:tetratricopeptide repeat-containing sulfotransferase family protein [Bradyrhizobium iriomotense]|uniref:Sulfotransferase n=1 Tax=Bradyrhizobium iriomotense TaxID=441950 RepID=A0ABQ6ASV2_9BRAD|nr:tetratricopeptide repeat-containing sulfotransferase family protein [Bradyrhizobium iriomotense]GLR85318.1 sulfotransferase [Bradyrhizobium iriomotense]